MQDGIGHPGRWGCRARAKRARRLARGELARAAEYHRRASLRGRSYAKRQGVGSAIRNRADRRAIRRGHALDLIARSRRAITEETRRALVAADRALLAAGVTPLLPDGVTIGWS